MPERPWTNEYTLLCEKCGYVIEGLDTSDNCPECGKPIAESLPERRVGTLWQQRRSPVTLIRSWITLTRHPKRCWDAMVIDPPSTDALIAWGFTLGLLVPSLPLMTYLLIVSVQSGQFELLLGGFAGIGITCVAYLVVALVYLGIAQMRMKLWAIHRGYRITSPIAQTIVAHASFGLALTPIIFGAGIVAVLAAALAEHLMGPDIYAHRNSLPTILAYAGLYMFLGSIPAGLIVFEILSSFGFRRMRYRNIARARPANPNEPRS